MVNTRNQVNNASVHTEFKSLDYYEIKKRKSQKQPKVQTAITVKESSKFPEMSELSNTIHMTDNSTISTIENDSDSEYKEDEEDEEEDEDDEDDDSIASEITTMEDLLTYQAKIDFEEASQEWTVNKKRNAQGMWVYVCGKIQKNGKKCMRAQCDKIGFYSGCKQHYAWEEKENHWLGDTDDPIWSSSSDSSPSTSL